MWRIRAHPPAQRLAFPSHCDRPSHFLRRFLDLYCDYGCRELHSRHPRCPSRSYGGLEIRVVIHALRRKSREQESERVCACTWNWKRQTGEKTVCRKTAESFAAKRALGNARWWTSQGRLAYETRTRSVRSATRVPGSELWVWWATRSGQRSIRKWDGWIRL